MLDQDILTQLQGIFADLTGNFILDAECDTTTDDGKQLAEFVTQFCSVSPRLEAKIKGDNPDALQFMIVRDGVSTGIVFRGIPLGHEFNTLLLAILNADGKGRNLPDELMRNRIERLSGSAHIDVYVSLTCTNCPDVAQACNIIALTNPAITVSIVDGGKFQDEVEHLGIQAVPTVYADGEMLTVGRATLSDIVGKLESKLGSAPAADLKDVKHEYDLLVVGGGPAGVASAIYTARKGLKVAIVAKETGGSVNLTEGIENLITTTETTGSRLAAELRNNADHYGVDLYEDREVERVNLDADVKEVVTISGERFFAPQVIISTGSKPRRINVPGEDEYTGRGVAFCPHCDGPMFAGKDVAVIGGGNAGIEAAIDLSGICKSVTVYEFLDTLKADEVLVARARSTHNISIHTSMQVLEVKGDGSRVTGLVVKDRNTGETTEVKLDGVFVQIGSVPNSTLFDGMLEINRVGEIVTDRNGRTSLAGVYAAGDVTDITYKQIVIAIGQGASAALAAFDDRIRR